MALAKKQTTELRSFKLIVKELDEARKLAKTHLGYSGATELIINLLRNFVEEYRNKPIPNPNQKELDL